MQPNPKKDAPPLTITPVILAGGKGKRLRPLTGPNRPKPFLRLFSQYSLLQETLLRVQALAIPLIISEEKNKNRLQQHLAEINQDANIILEPEAKSTAAAIFLAALQLKDRKTLMLVMPSDHIIQTTPLSFSCHIKEIAEQHPENSIQLLGAKPSSPQSRYGYITYSANKNGPHTVQNFIEKPKKSTAQTLLKTRDCFWNTGIFLCTPKTLLAHAQKYTPEVLKYIQQSYEMRTETKNTALPEQKAYKKIPSISFDYAILEKSNPLHVSPLNFPWYDVGCWSTIMGLKFKKFRSIKTYDKTAKPRS